MKNAITFHSETHPHLFYTARKKKNHYEFVSVLTGAALIRLGKWEYLVLPGEAFWLPFDALSSITVVPNSSISTIKFSVRTRELLPTNGGYVEISPLLFAGIQKLQSSNLTEHAEQRLLQVMQDELLTASLHTELSVESKSINSYLASLTDAKDAADSQVSPDMMMALKVREADKMRKSGAKDEMIAKRYFSGNVPLLQQMFSLLN